MSKSKNKPIKDQQPTSTVAERSDLFVKHFTKESDRAAVIVTSVMFENALKSLLLQYFLPNPSSSDELFDGSNAPLASFSARIAIAHRAGLISARFARNLNLMRKIRNEFAHNLDGCDFQEARIKDQVLALYKSQVYGEVRAIGRGEIQGARAQFLIVASWMLWHLHALNETTTSVVEPKLEFGFTLPERHPDEA